MGLTRAADQDRAKTEVDGDGVAALEGQAASCRFYPVRLCRVASASSASSAVGVLTAVVRASAEALWVSDARETP